MRPPQKNRNNRNKNSRHKPVGNVQNRVHESAGPEGKVRGTPQQIIEKYTLLARDAQTAGDRVTSENFLQHAEHYIRLLNAAQAQMEERRAQERDSRGDADGDQNQHDGRGDGDGDGDDHDSGRRDAPRGDRGRKADDALATFGGEDDAGPVETPESGARSADRATGRAPEPAPEDAPKPEAAPEAQAEGGEEAAAPPRRRRRRASPPADAPAPGGDEVQPG